MGDFWLICFCSCREIAKALIEPGGRFELECGCDSGAQWASDTSEGK